MIVDAHCHLTAELGAEELVEIMDQAGVDRAVLLAQSVETFPGGPADFGPPLGIPESLLAASLGSLDLGSLGRLRYDGLVDGGRLRISRAWFATVSAPDNRPVAAALRTHPDRFIGFVSVNPADPGHLETVDRYLAAGFRGVKVHAWFHRVDLRPALYPLARRLGEIGFPLLVHLGGSYRTGLAILELADRLPTTDFILAHAGIPYFDLLWRAARTRPNLYFDLSGPYLSARMVAQAASRLPPGRVLFASGAPHGLRQTDGSHSYATVRGWLSSVELGRGARRAVQGGNLLRLVGLGPGGAAPTASVLLGGSA